MDFVGTITSGEIRLWPTIIDGVLALAGMIGLASQSLAWVLSAPGDNQGNYFRDGLLHFRGKTFTDPTILGFDPDYGHWTV